MTTSMFNFEMLAKSISTIGKYIAHRVSNLAEVQTLCDANNYSVIIVDSTIDREQLTELVAYIRNLYDKLGRLRAKIVRWNNSSEAEYDMNVDIDGIVSSVPLPNELRKYFNF